MGAVAVIELFESAIFLVFMIVAVLITPGLLVGLFISVFQAATQINEQTLSFIPRLLVTFMTLILLGPWLLHLLMDFTTDLYSQIMTFVV